MTNEKLAEELHKLYRAAFKALHSGKGSFMGVGKVQSKAGSGCHNGHDHGWSHCNKKKYFLNRARILQEAIVKSYDELIAEDLL